jgi:hypothetical protein
MNINKNSGAPWTIDEDKPKKKKKEMVNHPDHYGGGDNTYEAIKVIEAWDLGFCLGNTVKYISRAGKKDETIQELEKALWYLKREIKKLKSYGKEGSKTSSTDKELLQSNN